MYFVKGIENNKMTTNKCTNLWPGMGNDEYRISNKYCRNSNRQSFDIRYSAVHHSTFKKDMVEFPRGFCGILPEFGAIGKAQGAGRECVIWQGRK
jgi:hypothetical protein